MPKFGTWLCLFFLTRIAAFQGIPEINKQSGPPSYPAGVSSCARYVPLVGRMQVFESFGYVVVMSTCEAREYHYALSHKLVLSNGLFNVNTVHVSTLIITLRVQIVISKAINIRRTPNQVFVTCCSPGASLRDDNEFLHLSE